MQAGSDAYVSDTYGAAQARSLAVLFIVENSQTVLDAWPDVLPQYLGSIVSRISANQADIIRYFLTESSTEQGQSREFASVEDAWRQLRFDSSPRNRLSYSKVWSGVEFFARPDAFLPHVSRHIVIVAASPPLEDNANVWPVNLAPWHSLARQLAQASLKCHMILSPTESMISFETLFNTSLALQGGFEDHLLLPVDANRTVIKLCGVSAQMGLGASGDPHTSSMPTSHLSLQRRNNSFPSDIYHTSQRMQYPAQQYTQHAQIPIEPAPTIVSQLQHIHGVTKKKPYANSKSPRRSFFKDERYTPETNDPSYLLPLTNSGGRAPSLSKVDRAVRIAQAGSPTEAYPRRPSVPRRNSRLSSSPDIPGSISPLSQSPLNPSPTSPTFNMYPPHTTISQGQHVQTDPSWLQAYPVGTNEYPYQNYTTGPSSSLSHSSATGPASHGGNTGSTYQYANSARRPTSPSTSVRASASSPKRPHRRSSNPEDDEPFTFDESYVAVTGELWDTVVRPVYPGVPSMMPDSSPPATMVPKVEPPRPRSTRNTFYIPEEIDASSGTTLPNTFYQGSHDSYATNTPLDYPASTNTLTSTYTGYPVYTSAGSSSLIGWAG